MFLVGKEILFRESTNPVLGRWRIGLRLEGGKSGAFAPLFPAGQVLALDAPLAS